MNNLKKPLLLSDFFTKEAHDLLFTADPHLAIVTMQRFYDDAFVYGVPGKKGKRDEWDIDKRALILNLYRTVTALFKLSANYIDGSKEIESVVTEFENLYENYGDELLQILEEIMMTSVHYKWDEIGNVTNTDERDNDYQNYLVIKQVIKGYRHPEWFYDVTN